MERFQSSRGPGCLIFLLALCAVSRQITGDAVSKEIRDDAESEEIEDEAVDNPISGGSVTSEFSATVGSPGNDGTVDNPFDGGAMSSSFGGGAVSNQFGSGAVSNSFGGGAESNPFGGGAVSSSFGGGAESNSFGGGAVSSPFGGGAVSNHFGGGEVSNPFGGGAVSNPFVGGAVSNPFGGGEVNNQFGGGAVSNPFGGGAVSNPFGGGAVSNPFGGGTVGGQVGGGAVGSQFGGSGTRSCILDDNYIGHEQEYTHHEPGACLRYRCQNGQLILAEAFCRDPKLFTCYKIGERLQTGRCTERTCVQTEGYIMMAISRRACDYKDRCLQHGETVTENCLAYRCSIQVVEGNKFIVSLDLITKECPDDNGACHPADGKHFYHLTVAGIRRKCYCIAQGEAIGYSCESQRYFKHFPSNVPIG